MIRPTAYLNIAVCEDRANSELFSSLKRAYSYVAPLSCSTGKVTEITVRVKLSGHPFWNSADAEQRRVWSNILIPWLEIKLKKIQDTVKEYNNEKTRSFSGSLPIDRLSLRLESCTVTFAVQNDRFPAVVPLLEELRKTLNEAKLLDSLESVYVPWPCRAVAEAEAAKGEGARQTGADNTGSTTTASLDEAESNTKTGSTGTGNDDANVDEATSNADGGTNEIDAESMWMFTLTDGSTRSYNPETCIWL